LKQLVIATKNVTKYIFEAFQNIAKTIVGSGFLPLKCAEIAVTFLILLKTALKSAPTKLLIAKK
jgi:hypothetical protein